MESSGRFVSQWRGEFRTPLIICECGYKLLKSGGRKRERENLELGAGY